MLHYLYVNIITSKKFFSIQKLNCMKTIIEEMRKYAGIITEDVTPEYLNKKLTEFIKKDYSEADILKVINTYCKEWIRFTPFDSKKLLKVSINPLGWDPVNGGKIDDAVAKGNEKIKNIFQRWVKQATESELKKYPGYKIWVEKRTA